MNYELFIARRILFSSQGTSISKPIVRIAVAGVALGFAVMIIAIAVVSGFKKKISDKVIGFGSHVQISSFTENFSYETKPIEKDSSFITELKNIPGVNHVQEFAIKAGIIKSKTDIEGVVMKGVSQGYDWSYLRKNLVEGSLPQLHPLPILHIRSIRQCLSKCSSPKNSPTACYSAPTTASFFTSSNNHPEFAN